MKNSAFEVITKRGCLLVLVLVAGILILCMPADSYGQVGIGVAAYSDTPVLRGSNVDEDGLALGNDLNFGANGRIRFNNLNLDALAFFDTPTETVNLYLTGQLSIPILPFLRFSAGVGPALRFYYGDEDYESFMVDWLNGKADLELVLGRISLGLSLQYILHSPDSGSIDFDQGLGRIGASVILW